MEHFQQKMLDVTGPPAFPGCRKDWEISKIPASFATAQHLLLILFWNMGKYQKENDLLMLLLIHFSRCKFHERAKTNLCMKNQLEESS